MNKFDRVTSILVYLQTKSVVTARELAERFDVSERTIYRDLRSLENAGVPLGAEAGTGYFLDTSWRLPPVAFTREEGASLLLAAKMLETRVDAVTRDGYASALDKIRSVMAAEDRGYLEAMDGSLAAYRPKTTGTAAERAGRDAWLPECRRSLAESRVVAVRYAAAFSGEDTERALEPIGLYHHSAHWHLIAWCRLREGYRDFRLDRIVSLTVTAERFAPGERASLDDYLARESTREPYEIVVEFSIEAARFVGEQRHHFGVVRERETEDGVEMTFVTPHLEYLGRWLLQFASGASSRDGRLRPVMRALTAELGDRWGTPTHS